ncbi:hypothetical protein [Burkholderia lata]|uniref:hypothetical protein n=1 Tax=Burkholderia lata (strain ATCC 17760 / DSM 23089 / LMG 22485 / NCIMB 9086 / R18194 / 383) TaxID=482957 RepID=UPI00399ACE42
MTAKDMVAALNRDGLHSDFIGEAVFKKPVIQAENVSHAVHADASVDGTGFVADTDHETRPGAPEIAYGFRMTDIETFNQLCVEFGWSGLRIDCSNDRVPSVAAVEFFHVQFVRVLRRDPVEILGYCFKYATTRGFDGVPAPKDWLMKVAQYIAAGAAARATPVTTN